MTEPLEVSVARLRKQIQARADEIKADFLAYIEQETDLVNDVVPVSSALLDLALDRFVELHGEQDARHLVDSAFRRTVVRWKARMN